MPGRLMTCGVWPGLWGIGIPPGGMWAICIAFDIIGIGAWDIGGMVGGALMGPIPGGCPAGMECGVAICAVIAGPADAPANEAGALGIIPAVRNPCGGGMIGTPFGIMVTAGDLASGKGGITPGCGAGGGAVPIGGFWALNRAWRGGTCRLPGGFGPCCGGFLEGMTAAATAEDGGAARLEGPPGALLTPEPCCLPELVGFMTEPPPEPGDNPVTIDETDEFVAMSCPHARRAPLIVNEGVTVRRGSIRL